MSGPNNIALCVEHDEAHAMYGKLSLAVYVFCFRAATSTLWLGGPRLNENRPACQGEFIHELNASKPAARPVESRGPWARNALSIVRQMARRCWFCSVLHALACTDARRVECNSSSNTQRWVTDISWNRWQCGTCRSSGPSDQLRPWSCGSVWSGMAGLPLLIRSRPSFGFLEWVDTKTPTLLETQLMALLSCLSHD